MSDYAQAHRLELQSAPLRLDDRWLCLTDSGLGVFEAKAEGNLEHRILSQHQLPTLTEGRVVSHLSLGTERYRISFGDLKLLRCLLRLAPRQSRPVAASHLLDLSPLEHATLARVLQADEVPLAAGHASRKASRVLVLTTRRLFELDADTDLLHRMLHPTASAESPLPKSVRLRQRIGDVKELELTRELLAERDAERAFRTARAIVAQSSDHAPVRGTQREAAAALLKLAAELGHPYANGVSAWLHKRHAEPRQELTLPPNLWQLLHEWNLSYDDATWLLLDSEIPLTDQQRSDLVRATLPQLQDAPRVKRISQQVVLAKHLSQRSLLETTNILEGWLHTLGPPTPEQLRDFLEGKTDHAPEQSALRLAAEVCNPDMRRTFQRRGLAFAPFEESWLDGLHASLEGVFKQRTNEARGVLFGGGTQSGVESISYPRQSLTEESLQDLQQSLASEGSTMNFLASKVGSVVEPDAQTLRQYCERLTDKDAAATRALGAAARLLGTPEVELYVSRGNNDIGVHAYPAKLPFILLGAQHIDPKSIYHTNEAALGFSFARELYYLKTNTPRLTQRDLRRGLLKKGRQGFDIALSVLPFLGTLRLSKRIGVIGAKFGAPKAMETLRTAKDLSEHLDVGGRIQSAELGVRSETVVDFRYRAAFIADRVGLICSRSFKASVIAILRSRTDTARAAIHLEKQPLLELLESLASSSQEAHTHVLMRVALLLSFFVSEEFERIVTRIYGEGSNSAPPA